MARTKIVKRFGRFYIGLVNRADRVYATYIKGFDSYIEALRKGKTMADNPSMFDLGEAGYPQLTISRRALPFADADVGDTFKLIAEVKLNNIMQEGNSFIFQVRKVGFPAKQPDAMSIGGRIESRDKKGVI